MNAAKHARKLKHIRRVKNAIRYEEQRRERLKPIEERRRATKDYIKQRLHLEKTQNLKIKAALQNADEDWKLGPLRPNRAVGIDPAAYGAANGRTPDGHIMYGELPEHWYGANPKIQKRMKERIPTNVLLNQWPIVAGDRVVVIRGLHANKVGKVLEVNKGDNTVTVEGIDHKLLDNSKFPTALRDEEATSTTPTEIRYNDVRLVMPHDEYKTENGRTIRIRRDVIVEAIGVEWHTSGIDPFTGEEKVRIPEEHQVDPMTEEPIFHRYIAGTRIPIKWPWEEAKKSAEIQTDVAEAEADEPKGVRGLLNKANPISWFRGEKKKNEAPASEDSKTTEKEENYDPKQVTTGAPRQELPEYEDDTTRNLVEMAEGEGEEFQPTLVNPPMPPTVIDELVNPYSPIKSRKDLTEEEKKAHYARMDAVRETKEQERQQRINSMKTPMQIRWELQQAKKKKYDPKTPTPPAKDLLLALGKHMAANGKGLDKDAAKRARLHAARVKAAQEAASIEAGELTA